MPGQRFVAEDSYHARTSAHVLAQPDATAYLIADSDHMGEQRMPLVPLKDGYETVEEMEAALELPVGSLVATMARYDEHAARGEDPDFHKHPDWLAPQSTGPWGVFDLSLGRRHRALVRGRGRAADLRRDLPRHRVRRSRHAVAGPSRPLLDHRPPGDRPAASCAWETSREAVVFGSFSKYFSMTGWRLGWMLAPPRLRRAVEVLGGNFSICPPVLAQRAALAAFDDASYAELDGHVQRYAHNRDLLLDGLGRLERSGLFCPKAG